MKMKLEAYGPITLKYSRKNTQCKFYDHLMAKQDVTTGS